MKKPVITKTMPCDELEGVTHILAEVTHVSDGEGCQCCYLVPGYYLTLRPLAIPCYMKLPNFASISVLRSHAVYVSHQKLLFASESFCEYALDIAIAVSDEFLPEMQAALIERIETEIL